MRIVITDAATVTSGDVDLTVLADLGELEIYDYTEPHDILPRIRTADAVLCNKTLLTAEILKSAENLKYIGLFATGYNNIDIDCAKQLGIRVCNAGSYSNDAVVQHTFGLILNYFTKISEYQKYTAEGLWKKSKTFSPLTFCTDEIAGKTLGIVGYGSIGKAVAKVAKAFNMEVIAYTRTPKTDKIAEFVSFDELLHRSDIISVHCPLNDQTAGMFNLEAFKKCKSSAYFVNTARGGVVNENDLAFALETGIIAGAAADVLCTEPMSENCVLYGTKNLTLTPHVAWAPTTTRTRLVKIVYDNLAAFKKGEKKNIIV